MFIRTITLTAVIVLTGAYFYAVVGLYNLMLLAAIIQFLRP